MTVDLSSGCVVKVEIDEAKIKKAVADATGAADGVRLVDTTEVAGLLKCSQKHVRNLLERGQFPEPIRLGHLLRWRLVDIQSFLTGHQSTAGAA